MPTDINTDAPSTPASPAAPPSTALTSSYADQFGPWVSAAHVEPRAIESSTQPLAYLDALWTLACRLEPADTDSASSLGQRRPDIGELQLGEPALNEVVPTLRLTVAILEGLAYQAAPAELKVATAGVEPSAASVTYQMLRQATSPFTLPYDRAWALILQVCWQKKVSPWKLLRKTDYTYPNFGDGSIVQASMRDALGLCLGMAPVQLEALSRPIETTNNADWWSRVGLPLANADTPATTLARLSDTRAFLTWTGLTRKRMRKLLAVYGVAQTNDPAPHTSVSQSRYGLTTGTPASHLFAASFINASDTTALRLKAGNGNTTLIDGLTVPHLDRIWRVLQLRQAIGCSFPETDRLLQAIMVAQHRGTAVAIDDHAIRAVGLYCHLRDVWDVSVDAFAAVIERISPYATGREISYYDQLFLPTGEQDIAGLGAPLTMDGTTFDPAADADQATVRQLCAGLRIRPSTLRTLCDWVGQPRRDLAFVSACHRLVMLPRWFGLDENEGLALLALLELDQPDLFDQLIAITPEIETDPMSNDEVEAFDLISSFEEPYTVDIIDAIATIMNMVEWFRQHRLSTMAVFSALDLSMKVTALDDEWKARFKTQRRAWKGRSDTTSADNLETVALTDEQQRFAEQSLRTLLGTTDAALLHPLLAWDGRSLGSVLALYNKERPASADMAWLLKMQRRAQVLGMLGIGHQALNAAVSDPSWFDLDDDGRLRDLDMATVYRLMTWTLTVRAVSQHTRKAYDQAEAELLTLLARTNHPKGLSRAATAQAIEGLLGIPAATVLIGENYLPATDKHTGRTRFVHARALAWLLRIHELAEKTSLTVDALLAMSSLTISSSPDTLDAAGQLLLAACSADEREAIQGNHDASRRDAVTAWLLAHAKDTTGKAFSSREALSAWALTDLDVGPEPRTTRVAQAIDGLQLYIKRLLSGEEGGIDSQIDIEAERKQWTESHHTYAVWKRRVEGALYPENRFDPTLRTRPTPEYSALQTQLAQAGDNAAAIEKALSAYIADFERNSAIQIVAGYQEDVDVITDKLHFVGCTLTQPIEYYWRTVDLSLVTTEGLPSILAWGAWQKVFPAITGTIANTQVDKSDQADKNDARETIPAIRPVVIRGRRYLVWAERETMSLDLGDKANPYYTLTVSYSYCDAMDNWSPANKLIQLDGFDENGNRTYTSGDTPDKANETGVCKRNARLVSKSYLPGLIAMEDRSGDRERDPHLVVLLFDSQLKKSNIPDWNLNSNYFIEQRDLSLNPIDNKDAKKTTSDSSKTWLPFFYDSRVLQHPYIGTRTIVREASQRSRVIQPIPEKTETRIRSITTPGDVKISAALDATFKNLTVSAKFDGVWRYGDNTLSCYRNTQGIIYFPMHYFNRSAAEERSLFSGFLFCFCISFSRALQDTAPTENSVKVEIALRILLTAGERTTFDHIYRLKQLIRHSETLTPIDDYTGDSLSRDIARDIRWLDMDRYGITNISPEQLFQIAKNDFPSPKIDTSRFTAAKEELKKSLQKISIDATSEIFTLSEEVKNAVKNLAASFHDPWNKSTISSDFPVLLDRKDPLVSGLYDRLDCPNTETLRAELVLIADNYRIRRETRDFLADGNTIEPKISITLPIGAYGDMKARLKLSKPRAPGSKHDFAEWKTYTLPFKVVRAAEDLVSTISIRYNAKQVQYLDLHDKQDSKKVVRTNTLIAKEIAQRVSTHSYSEVIAAIGTELTEPPITSGASEAIDFGGANGIYFGRCSSMYRSSSPAI